MRARIFIEGPQEVQESVRLLIAYMTLARAGRPPPIYGKAIKRACRLLKIMAQPFERGRPVWMLPREWRERMRLAGLDPDDPLRVVNQARWDRAWEQLRTTNTFRDDVARKQIATGYRAPRAEPVVRAIAVKPRREKKTHEAQFKLPSLKNLPKHNK